MKLLLIFCLSLFSLALTPANVFGQAVEDQPEFLTPSECDERFVTCRCLSDSGATVRGKNFNSISGGFTEDSCNEYCSSQVDELVRSEAEVIPETYQSSCHWSGDLVIFQTGAIAGIGNPDFLSQYDPAECIEGTIKCLCPPGSDVTPFPSFGRNPTESIDVCRTYCQARRNDPAGISHDAAEGSERPEQYTYQCQVPTGSGNELVTVSAGPLSETDIGGISDLPVKSPNSLLGGGAIIPQLAIAIPGLTQDDLKEAIAKSSTGDTRANFLGVYIVAAYNVLIALAALVSVAILMGAGFVWLTSGGSQNAIGRAKDMIKNALVGLLLLFSAFTIGNLIDSRLTQFAPLTLVTVEKNEIFPDGEHWEVTARRDIPVGLAAIESSSTIEVIASNSFIVQEAIAPLEKALQEFKDETGYKAVLTGGARSNRRQLELFYDHCLAKPGGVCDPPTCNPAGSSGLLARSGRGWVLAGSLAGVTDRTTVINALDRVSNPSSCPHSSGVALDIWCEYNRAGKYTFNPECQTALAKALTDNGFCRLTYEPWHFEFNKYKISQTACTMSATPSYKRTDGTEQQTPYSCERWSYNDNECLIEAEAE